MKKQILLLSFLTLFCFGIQAQCPSGNVIYVNANASGANDGSSWTDAFTKLQDALSLTSSCAAVTELWVAKGTYFPDEGGGKINDDRTASFSMKNGIAIYGGFPNSGNPIFTDRNSDPNTNGTVLSGEIGASGNSDNSIHILLNPAGLNATAIIDGFQITNGNAQGPVVSDNRGAGMYNYYCSPIIRNCLFQNNIAVLYGGAIYNYGENGGNSSPQIIHCAFIANSAQFGGALNNSAHFGNSNPSFTECLFKDNSVSVSGGAIYNSAAIGQSDPTFTNCVFQNNSAQVTGGAVYSYGGGNNAIPGSSSPVFTNCSFQSNSAGVLGGALSNFGYLGASNVTLVNCVFFDNGGASTFYNDDASTTANYCFFEPTVSGYSGSNNIVDAVSPFASSTDEHLRSGSPSINAGTNSGAPSKDIDGNTRALTIADAADMGAYEYSCTAFVPAITGSLSFCTGSSTTLDAGAFSHYEWSTTETSRTITVNTASTFTVTVTDANGCTGSNSIATTINALPTPSITGTTTFCAGSSETLTASGAAGNAFNFNGANQYLTAPNIPEIDPANAITLEAWVNPSDVSGVKYIISKGTNDQAAGHYGLLLYDNKAHFSVEFFGGGIVSNANITANTWTHLAGTWDGTTVRLYINGVIDNTSSYSATKPANTGALQIGWLGQAGYLYQFKGMINEVRIWNTERTQTEIQSGMNAIVQGNSAGLVAYYKMDEVAGSTTPDASVNGNTATLVNAPTQVNASTTPVYYPGNLWSTTETTPTISIHTASTFSVIVTDLNGCTGSASVTTTVNQLPVVTAVNVSGCAGSSITLSGSPAGGTWSVANPYTGSSTTYTHTYTDGNNCTNTSSAATITVNPLPVVTAVNVSGCAGTSIALSGTPSGGTWSVANPYTGSSTTYTHSYTNGNGCTGTSAAATITVNPKPSAAGVISGPAKVCCYQTGLIYTVGAIANATSYVWTLPSGMSPVSGGLTTNTNSITVKTTVFSGGSITVKGSNACGYGTVSPSFAVSKYTTAPSTPTAINNLTGTVYGYCAGTTYTFTTTATNADGFTWTTSCGTIMSGQGTNQVTVKIGSSCSSCVISVTAKNCYCTSAARSLTLKSILPAPSISGPTAVCKNSSALKTYTVSGTSGATSYTWSSTTSTIKFSAGGTPSNPLTTTSTSVTVNYFGIAMGTRNVRVTANNSCGSSPVASKDVCISNCTKTRAEEQPETVESVKTENSLNVFPNPTHDKVTVNIDFKENTNCMLRLMDLSGRIIVSEEHAGVAGFNTFDLNLANLPKGVYLLVVESANERLNKMLVVE